MRVLDAATYDYLMDRAEKYGGVGAGGMFDYPEVGHPSPLCIYGLADHASAITTSHHRMALLRVGIVPSTNDMAVGGYDRRIPFAEWCRRLDVVREEADPVQDVPASEPLEMAGAC